MLFIPQSVKDLIVHRFLSILSSFQAATLKWLHENTNIPIPLVFACDENPANAVGAAYMIQDRVRHSTPGECLFSISSDHVSHFRSWEGL